MHKRGAGFFFAGILCLLMALLPVRLILLFLLSAGLHECGHLIAMRMLGIPIRGFYALGGGAVLCGDMQGISYLRELLTAAAGPAVNLLLALMFAGVPQSNNLLRDGMLLNLMLAGYNLLPLSGNDGAVMLTAAGDLLGCGTWMRRGLAWVSGFLFAVLLMMGAWVLWYGALKDQSGYAVGYGAMFFCLVLRGVGKEEVTIHLNI